MVNNLSDLSALENYTINLIEKTSPITQPNQMCTKKNEAVQHSEKMTITDLNQAFSKDSLSQSTSDTFKLNAFKNNSISIEDALNYQGNLRNSNTQTNLKQSSQLNDCPMFEGSCISNGSVVMPYTSSLLACSTQISNNFEQKINGHASLTKKNLSPLTEPKRTTRSSSKSCIKITPLNIKIKEATLAPKDMCSPPNINVDTLISSDESNEISEDQNLIDSDESTSSKKQKKIHTDEVNHYNNLAHLPLSPVISVAQTSSVGFEHLSIITNTMCEKYDVEINKNDEELMSIEKPYAHISTEENLNNNRGRFQF